ncbi:MAG: UDP-N-acetylmuramoyl-L-alanyl-D-glutamate--2,6-diaminopimelate ligase [Deltaproteobacteria bacterium]|nr:UDP-N-acetylmuramoyl-L-alanyl-D-glutamate--2,6-diaminopimelate ligase [Deltaproteobacteria bacterium]
MKIKELFKGFTGGRFFGDDSIPITSIAIHSQKVVPGGCFIAIRGFETDGHRYIPDAVARGAKVVVMEKDCDLPRKVTKVIVDDARDCLARLSANFYGDPSRQFHLVGITGTNGKTTTAYLLEKIWASASWKTGLLTTVCNRYGSVVEPAQRTTAEAPDLQRMFREMADQRVRACAMEVTSHGIDLKRVVGCHFDGAIFTNLSQDHLDYHGTLENYFAVKARLFRERLVVSEKKKLWAVLNWDDPYGRTLVGGLPAKVWRFSKKDPAAEVFLKNFEENWNGLRGTIQTPKGALEFSSPLISGVNSENILAAVAASLAMDIPVESILDGIASFEGVPGRLQKIKHSGSFQVIVDYAHTPAALEGVLQTLRGLKPKRLLVVFGCGGNRDQQKRAIMGKIAERLADVVILTSDNPRKEDPEKILQDIQSAMMQKEKHFIFVDRREALSKAVAMAQPGDCLLVAGKGHETTQETMGEKRPFDDREVLKEFLK